MAMTDRTFLTAAEPIVAEEVLKLLKQIWDSGSAVSSRFAGKYHPEVIVKAVQAELVTIDVMAQQVRTTERGIAAP